jgi:predicted RNA-binding Zn ribbon-like protein
MTGRAGSSEPGGRAPAPEPLRLVQRFVNTNDREGGVDRLASPAALSRWFRAAGVTVGRLEERDLARAIELREALRVLLGANNGLPLEAAASR